MNDLPQWFPVNIGVLLEMSEEGWRRLGNDMKDFHSVLRVSVVDNVQGRTFNLEILDEPFQEGHEMFGSTNGTGYRFFQQVIRKRCPSLAREIINARHGGWSHQDSP